jgi:cytochrome c oxidase cbb3-type subunit I/II
MTRAVVAAALLVAPMLLPARVPASEPDAAPASVLLRGRQVYAANCATCHGFQGGGNGHAAHMFLIRPRDFRRGVFKFRSTPSGAAPTDADLLRTVTEGLRWTAMIGRADLPERDRDAVVQYVKTLAWRWGPSAAPWRVPSRPPRTPARLEEGRRLYAEAGCGKCHGDRARGDGPSAAGMKDDWGWPTRPTDLGWRPLKRGSTPESIYLTVATGLSGTPMPSYGDSLDGDQLWALVQYLDSLVPAERRLSPARALGEEPRGWMVLRMGWMMGGGMMGRGMMGP